jgi:hypothetical protein
MAGWAAAAAADRKVSSIDVKSITKNDVVESAALVVQSNARRDKIEGPAQQPKLRTGHNSAPPMLYYANIASEFGSRESGWLASEWGACPRITCII